jgi:hypothetical protein
MPEIHPRRDDAGQPVVLTAPSTPTPYSCWEDPTAIARLEGELGPHHLAGLLQTPFLTPFLAPFLNTALLAGHLFFLYQIL